MVCRSKKNEHEIKIIIHDANIARMIYSWPLMLSMSKITEINNKMVPEIDDA